MSQYTHIFIRKNDIFIELGCFSRNNEIAQAINEAGAPWEKIKGYMESDIREIRDDLKKKIDQLNDEIASTEAVIHEVGTWNNTVEEKREAIADYKEQLNWLKEELDETNYAYAYLDVMMSIAYNSELDQKYEQNKEVITPAIYCGIECGSDVTVDDIDA
jgi:predicted nuclease with TOPRIM domain